MNSKETPKIQNNGSFLSAHRIKNSENLFAQGIVDLKNFN